jgi:hypothetical protein
MVGALLKNEILGVLNYHKIFFYSEIYFSLERLIFQLKNCFKQSLNKIAWKIFPFIIRIDTEWTLLINRTMALSSFGG